MLTAVAARGLQLKGAVVYAQLVKQMLHAVGDLFEHCGFGYHDVARQRRLGGGDGPYVHMMHVEHPFL